MKANEFFREFGLGKARELIDKSIKSYGGIGESLYFCKDGYLSVIHPSYLTGSEFPVLDLKRLVESHELVEFYGGYELAKNVRQITPLRKASYDLIENLKQAIADVESCQ